MKKDGLLFLSNDPTNQGLKHKFFAWSMVKLSYSYPMIQQTKDWNKKFFLYVQDQGLILIQWSNKPRIETGTQTILKKRK